MQYSFIIPVYNCKAYLSSCVESILAVGVPDFEVVLVDDGSTDGSGALCDALAEKYPQVQAVHQENGGASAARNRGVREAGGEYILFVDSDDSLDSDLLREILLDPRCLDADMTIFGMSFDYYYHGKCYRRDPLYYDLDGVMTKDQWGRECAHLFGSNSLSSMCNKVFLREKLLQVRMDKFMPLYEDLECVLQYLQWCGDVFISPKAVYHYRQTEDEGNAKRRLKRVDSLPTFLHHIESSLNNLQKANPAVSQESVDTILLSLHLVLAREKISVSDLTGIRRICREFADWSEERGIPYPEESHRFHHRLLHGKALPLLLADKKTALRHKVAVWLKGNGLYR